MFNYKQKLVNLRHKLPDLLFYLLLVVYITGGITSIVISYIYNFNRESIGFAMLIGATLPFFIAKNKVRLSFDIKPRLFVILSLIFVFLSVLSIFVSVYSLKNYFLPIEFFIIISLMGTIILIQILYPKKLSKAQIYSILIQIFILSTIISASFLYLFPSHIGDDSSFHVIFINFILNSGHVNFVGGFANYQYSSYPIYHLFFVLLIQITGINDLKFIQFILAIVQILFLSFIYLLVNKFFKEKIALISVLLISIFPYIIQPHFNYFPSTFSVIFFMLGLYLSFKSTIKEYIILYIIAFAIILFSHPFTPMFFIAISLLVLIAYRFINRNIKLKKLYLSMNTLILMIILTIIWWMKPTTDVDLFTRFVNSINEALGSVAPTNANQATATMAYSFQDMFFYDLGLVLLILIAVFGSLFVIKHLKNLQVNSKIDQGLILLIITLLVIPIPYVLTIVYPSSLPERWLPFTGIFIGISAAVGFYILKNSSILNKKLSFIPILLIFFILFFNVTTPIVNPDAHIYSQNISSRAALTNSEIHSINFIDSNYNFKSIKGNSKYIDMITSPDISDESYINPDDPYTYSNGLIILRDFDFRKGFNIPFYKGNSFKNFYPTKEFLNYVKNSNEVYDNGNLSMYLNGGT